MRKRRDTGGNRQQASWEHADDAARRERTTLYVAVFRVPDARRRVRVQRLFASFGVEVAPFTFEIPTSPAGSRAFERALALELQPEDDVRIYPVCTRCRGEARVWGGGELAGLTPALIF